ncbi:MAG: hypothetical protein QNJ30_05355 [Kiloniellales bacterium]|nr:hypothetical protein [Kiloniellales bacterium]
MKRLLISLVLVLLLAGGGAAWWFLNQDAEPTEAEAPVEPAPKPNFVKIDPIILPLIQQNKVTRFVTLVITLEMPIEDAILKVELVKPRLMDALFTELHSLFSMKMVREQGPDSSLVKRRVKLVCERILGAGTVDAVLLQGVSQQRPNSG